MNPRIDHANLVVRERRGRAARPAAGGRLNDWEFVQYHMDDPALRHDYALPDAT